MNPIRSLLLGGLLLSATSIAMAQPPHDRDGDRDHDNHGDNHGHDNRYDHRDDRHDDRHDDRGRGHWERGHALPPQYRDRGHYVTDYRSYRLREPPRGYRWVRADDNFVLVAITTGLIADIVANSQ
jgi:Ni/Co efflux regulator RcnB